MEFVECIEPQLTERFCHLTIGAAFDFDWAIMDQTEKSAILELQQQVKMLTRVLIVLVVLTFGSGLIPFIAMSLILLPILAFTHQWIPPLARQIGRIISYFIPPWAPTADQK